ncbi:hypothetical protein, partial [Burkholderia sp. 8Y]|uniref:hypothetical protein n=1 Tax=Burkholderia sp. 8Y TaxID=2653133 RepID=UPI003FA46089
LRDIGNRRLVRLPQDRDHLLFGKPALLHDFLLSVGSHSLKFQLVRKFQGRSSAFLEYAKNQFGLSKTTTAQYGRVYERFVDSRYRAQMEALFNAGELAVLAAYSDDELTEIVSAKAATPSLTRDGIKQLLKSRQAA